jgi:fumarylacetoacetase
MNETHDVSLESWVGSATTRETDFPIQNLPFGVFRHRGSRETPHIGVAIGEEILDLARCAERGLMVSLPEAVGEACSVPNLNALMALPGAQRRELRAVISGILRMGSAQHREAADLLVAQSDADLDLPVRVGDYTDFYASIDHATNVGSMLRPDNPLLPNYKWVPIGYHGRASSIVVSGSPVVRPAGQTKAAEAARPTFGPSAMLDYEAEVGFYVAGSNALGEPVRIANAWDRLFGISLLNDWSARDIQAWEYQPLGPFLAKNFTTTVSPWVVTSEALEPFRVSRAARPAVDPEPLPYLSSEEDRERGGISMTVEVFLSSSRMRDEGIAALRLSRSELASLYWTPAQMLTHHTSNGCNLAPGDLLGSGTISGPENDARGCLLELTWRGRDPVTLPTGEQRKFLADGDEVIMRGRCHADGAVSIGLGECRGTIFPSRS